MPIKFGTDGWRAIIDEDFSDENVKLVAGAIVRYFKDQNYQSIVIGFDGRRKANVFAKLASEVMAGNDIKVYLIDKPCPTPTAAFSILAKNANGGIMFTASHNPPEFLGLKYMIEDSSGAPDAVTDQFIKNLAGLKIDQIETKSFEEAKKQGLIEVFNPKPSYFAALKKVVDVEKIKKADLKILLNTMHGSGAGYLKELLAGGKIQIDPINEKIDPNFGGVPPEPVKEKNIVDAIEKMSAKGRSASGGKQSDYDVCLISDGDADRVGAVDENGKMITSHEVFLLLAYYLIKIKGQRGPIVGSITHTVMVENLCKKYHLPYFETKVGFKWIGEKMKETGAILGSEESGGSAIPSFILVRDSQLVHLLILSLMIDIAKPISEIIKMAKAEAGGEFIYLREDVHFEYQGFEKIKNVKGGELVKNPPKEVLGRQVVKTRTDDGLKLFFTDGAWLLIRFSGTEPTLRLMAEAKTKKEAEALIGYAREYFGK